MAYLLTETAFCQWSAKRIVCILLWDSGQLSVPFVHLKMILLATADIFIVLQCFVYSDVTFYLCTRLLSKENKFSQKWRFCVIFCAVFCRNRASTAHFSGTSYNFSAVVREKLANSHGLVNDHPVFNADGKLYAFYWIVSFPVTSNVMCHWCVHCAVPRW